LNARFGRALRGDWRLDPSLIHLDHGAFGAALGVALDAQDRWRERLERDPAGFMTETIMAALAEVRADLAAFLGTDANALALVGNSTDGLNAVLRSQDLVGRRVVATNLMHPGLRQALRGVGADLVTVPALAPDTFAEALTADTALAVTAHVTSPGAVVLPVERICAACRERGVATLVDGAHGPGMLPLDLAAIGADWYVGSGHKWLCAPKGTAFVWASEARRDSLRPAIFAAERDQGFPVAFDWTGTRDASAWLALPAALDYWRATDMAAARAYMGSLAVHAGERLAAAWGTEALAPPEMTAAMVAVRAPVDEPAHDLRRRLRRDHGIVVTVNTIAGAPWVRASFPIYAEAEDVERLAASM
jgi:isopenicillin-N epimerase